MVSDQHQFIFKILISVILLADTTCKLDMNF